MYPDREILTLWGYERKKDFNRKKNREKEERIYCGRRLEIYKPKKD